MSPVGFYSVLVPLIVMAVFVLAAIARICVRKAREDPRGFGFWLWEFVWTIAIGCISWH
jgi:hypothetical protein